MNLATTLIGLATLFLSTSCGTNDVEAPIAIWGLNEEVHFYENTLRGYGVLGNVKGSLVYAQNTLEYKNFVERLPNPDAFESDLVYYEIGVNAGHYFFYWSGKRNGSCTAYYSTDKQPYVEVSECEFPDMQFASQPFIDKGEIFSDGVIVGLVVDFPASTSERLLAINPNVELGAPTSQSMSEKIEEVFGK